MNSIRLIFALCAFFLFSMGVSAQTSQATITKSGAVVLNDSEPLKGSYSLDASQFNFDNTEDALAHFQTVGTDLVFYRPVLNNGIVMMYLQLNKQSNWTKEDWNSYLESNKVLTTETMQSPSK